MKYTIQSIVLMLLLLGSHRLSAQEGIQRAENVYTVDIEDLTQYGIDTGYLVPAGLPTGMYAPDFYATDQRGESFRLSDIYKDHQVVLMFYRGHWCSICNAQLQKLSDSLDLLEDNEIKVIAVTPESMAGVSIMSRSVNARFSIVSDTTHIILDAYGVTFHATEDYTERIEKSAIIKPTEDLAHHQAILPVPATYLIDRGGEIIYAHFDPNYRKRASIRQILNFLN
ncbi:MAG: AhpC/TSA family protein [Lewinellaceae bacterium]|nr:AhpC/TSA family protein [Lewinellaceae bacterium]HPQ99817.1 peroxiredoxin-like family protein [Saprospiraceae bacterium]